MRKIDLAYVAGFFDGEGTIFILYHNYKPFAHLRYALVIAVAQSGRFGELICNWFKDNFGGLVVNYHYRKWQRKRVWRWECRTALASKVLKQICPYLKNKKEQAELAIEFQKYTSKFYKKPHLSDAERIEKYCFYETVRQEMHFLNRR